MEREQTISVVNHPDNTPTHRRLLILTQDGNQAPRDC